VTYDNHSTHVCEMCYPHQFYDASAMVCENCHDSCMQYTTGLDANGAPLEHYCDSTDDCCPTGTTWDDTEWSCVCGADQYYDYSVFTSGSDFTTTNPCVDCHPSCTDGCDYTYECCVWPKDFWDDAN